MENLKLTVFRKAEALRQKNKGLRRGQALFLALSELDPELSRILQEGYPESDCFYDDKKISAFMALL